jgi:hypothetical protein
MAGILLYLAKQHGERDARRMGRYKPSGTPWWPLTLHFNL